MKTLLKIALITLLSCQLAFAETDAEKLSQLQKEVATRAEAGVLNPNELDNIDKKLRVAFPELCEKLDKLPDIKEPDLWLQISTLELVLAINDGRWGKVEEIMESWIERYSPKQKTVLDDKIRKQPDSQLETKSAGTLDPFTLALPDGTKMEFIPIPAGTFMMGSPEDEEGRSDDENQVRVNITNAFYMGKTEVTEAQYSAVMNDDAPSNNGENEPVTKVCWGDAMSFCKQLTAWAHSQGKMLGWKFTLPTEAQWEYACRAGTTTIYYSGDKIRDLKRVAWYTDTPGFGTSPVGKKVPNAWGLYDMHGNVWEWCSDWYDRKLQGGENPIGPKSGLNRVNRGGSWSNEASRCRSAERDYDSPSTCLFNLGFRVALVRE
ncbi:MAG: formylglycine-generating enzyme family protein [Opitutales bacterium]|nr:formylglycine-generating enzyme family protein [Opitutales bacterium]